jgi:DNA-binding CsgD family transcriptional regulator
MRLLVAPSASFLGFGDPAGWLRDALATFEGLCLKPFARSCRVELRDIGEPVPRPGRTSQAQRGAVPPALAAIGITAREAEVLAHLAAGRSNRQIADTLFLSVRTVEKHVERIIMKTGVNRAGLAGLVAGAGVTSFG